MVKIQTNCPMCDCKEGKIVGYEQHKLEEIIRCESCEYEWAEETLNKIFKGHNKIITEEQIDAFMRRLEKDYCDGSKPLLIPSNNREYWLFTEIWQRCKDFFESLNHIKLDLR